MAANGTLIPIGGNEDKGTDTHEQYHLEFIQQSILARVVRESGGIYASIIVIPTASGIPVEVSENYIEAFNKLGCNNVHIMDIRSPEDSETTENLDLMKKADCIMFSGGNQSKITRCIRGSSLHKIMLKRYKKDRLVIAGTSAGANT